MIWLLGKRSSNHISVHAVPYTPGQALCEREEGSGVPDKLQIGPHTGLTVRLRAVGSRPAGRRGICAYADQ